MAASENVWTSREIVGLIVATGLISAFATWGLDVVRSFIRRRQAARYGAMRSAIALERYAVDCWNIFNMGKGAYQESREPADLPLPAAPDLPADIDWKALDGSLADQILSFSNITRISESLADYAAVFENNHFDYDAAAKERGYEALKLAARVRKAAGMKDHQDFDRIWKDFTD